VTDTILSIITQRVDVARRHKIEPHASLDGDLGLDRSHLWGIACEIEETLDFMFPGEPAFRWLTVQDVLDSVEGVMA
jgi:acyl carrier protein